MNRKNDKRTKMFLWQDKQELYAYFKQARGLEKDQVDEEIEAVMKSFKPRRDVAINTKELWQKAGIELERRMRRKKAKT